MSMSIMLNWVVIGLLLACIYKGLKILRAQERAKNGQQ